MEYYHSPTWKRFIFCLLFGPYFVIFTNYTQVGYVMATSKQMEQMNVTSVEAKDGSGSLVTLDVFHQLHCLVSDAQNLGIQKAQQNSIC